MNLIKVKISHPNWNDFGVDDLGMLTQTPCTSGIWGKYKFEINNECDECDFWVIISSTPETLKVKVPPGNTIFITSEEYIQHQYLPKYLKQFDRIITSRRDINGNNVIKDYYINGWFVRKTYDQLKNDATVIKTKKLSVISSNLVLLPGHRLRYEFVNRLIGHFKDKIDVFGKGYSFIDDKWDALAPYEYSVAIENASIHNYFTEKIVDCYLSETMPIYFGCPNITDFFKEDSLLLINPENYKESIRKIEEIIDGDQYFMVRKKIIEQKHVILDNYQFFPYLSRILDTLPIANRKRKLKIYPEQMYIDEVRLKTSLVQSYQYGKIFLKNLVQ
jgi:hypothetical protein